MRLAGLSEAIKQVDNLGGEIDRQIDELDPDDRRYDEKDQLLNDAWMEIDQALTALKDVQK